MEQEMAMTPEFKKALIKFLKENLTVEYKVGQTNYGQKDSDTIEVHIKNEVIAETYL